MRRVRLVIADRHPIVLQGFVSLLEAQPDFEVVACCLDGASCLAAIRSLTPDVVLLEDGFTDVTASDILAVVDDEGLSSRLVFFTATVACGDLARALATGACGAISTNAKPEALVQSLRLEKPGSDLARVGNEANGIASFGNNVLAVLTVNEQTIMDLIAEGLSDSEIARVLGVSLEIVRIHIDHARQKLGIKSRMELAALALSRRYGAMSILAAAILAALDDSPGHAATEGCTVMAENGCAEVVTIKISRKEAVSGGDPGQRRDQGPRRRRNWDVIADRQNRRSLGRDCREPVCAGNIQRAEAGFEQLQHLHGCSFRRLDLRARWCQPRRARVQFRR
ncbi:LuxR C-terminal-related transcriptional regulator [Bradyrhizobium sp. LB13.1]